MASRLPFNIEDTDNGCRCIFNRLHIHQLATNETYGEKQKGRKPVYTDTDFAREMQGLSLQERERVYEDVHLTSGQVEETEEFLNTKLNELLDVIGNHSKQRVQRDAWDCAVFLRPTLARDRDHYLMFLRVKKYEAYDAAMQLFKFYETKRRLWGDELVARRISWDDLSEDTRAVYEQHYAIWLPRNKENPSLKVWYFRSSIVDPDDDPVELVRANVYSFYVNILANEEIHRNGHVQILDFRGPYKRSTLQQLEHSRITIPLMETLPGRTVVTHFLVEKSAMTGFARSMQSIYGRDRRLRGQIHAGSWIEIQYSLRRFGIDIAADWLEGDVEGSPFSSTYIEGMTQEHLRIEEKWKRNEAPYCDPSSDIALYPNYQDIIMGRYRSFAPSWPGNMAYMALIHEYIADYGIVTGKAKKTAMAKEILHRLKTEFRVRFLNRKDGVGWEALSDEEARVKVSQSLRDEYRRIFKTGAF